MYNSVTVYNNYCVLTQIDKEPHELNVYEKAERKKKKDINKSLEVVNTSKLDNNLIRAKQKIFDYAIYNDFQYFFTGTINGDYNRKDYRQVFNKLTQKFRNIRKEVGELEYLIIVELHKDMENYHFHGLLKGNIDKYVYINKYGYLSFSLYDEFGFNSLSEIQDIEKCSSYITKYLSKSICIKEKGERCYFHSNGLKLPKKFGFFGDLTFEWDYQNFYCKKIKLPLDFAENFV